MGYNFFKISCEKSKLSSKYKKLYNLFYILKLNSNSARTKSLGLASKVINVCHALNYGVIQLFLDNIV